MQQCIQLAQKVLQSEKKVREIQTQLANSTEAQVSLETQLEEAQQQLKYLQQPQNYLVCLIVTKATCFANVK